jgi:hypothetical protein
MFYLLYLGTLWHPHKILLSIWTGKEFYNTNVVRKIRECHNTSIVH